MTGAVACEISAVMASANTELEGMTAPTRAGADSQAEQVISLRDRSDKGIVFLWTGSLGATAGLALLPLVILLVLLGLFLVLAQGSVLAPFIYSLF